VEKQLEVTKVKINVIRKCDTGELIGYWRFFGGCSPSKEAVHLFRLSRSREGGGIE
jgi:hypothetical protein